MNALYESYIALLLPRDSAQTDVFRSHFVTLACPTGDWYAVGALLFLTTTSACFIADTATPVPILGKAPAASAAAFIKESGPRIAANLRRQSKVVRAAPGQRIIGRVDWAATIKARATADSVTSRHRYVCRTNVHDFDRPENQLYFFMLAAMERCVALIQAGGMTNISTIASHRDGVLIHEAEDYLRAIRRILPASSHITLPTQITPRLLQAAIAVRSPEYANLPPLYQHYRLLVEEPTPDRWRSALSAILPFPAITRSRLHLPSIYSRPTV